MIKSQVKYIQSLSHKKQRDEDGVFIVEGPKLVDEMLSATNVDLVELYALESWAKNYSHLPVEMIALHELEKISALQTPNQVVGLFKKPVITSAVPLHEQLMIMLDTIQDPGNLGTIIRCADWFGVETIIASKDTVDAFNTKVVQSTMGSIARVKVVYTDLEEFIARNPRLDYYAAALDGAPLAGFAPIEKGVIMIGNESKGLADKLLARATHKITIPRKGKAESLNAAVATAIILSHC
jgi:TrmH family RNA methyltransferase